MKPCGKLPNKGRPRWIALCLSLLALGALAYSAKLPYPLQEQSPQKEAAQVEKAVPHTNEILIAVEPPPFSEDIFPCSECHDPTDEIDRKPHPVEFHEDIVLHHDEENRWCLDCHDAQHRDRLHLADGRPVEFTESYRLCGQCHGPELKDWKAGVHGKRTGMWSGKKTYLLCVHCHSPHSPAFKAMEPLPPPKRPEAHR